MNGDLVQKTSAVIRMH